MLVAEQDTATGAGRRAAAPAAAERWFHGGARPRPGALRMVCFPHAGGTPTVYQGWTGALGDRVQVVPVLPPGRGLRTREEPYRDLAALAEATATALLECRLADDYVLFGHSMGALAAYETACRLRSLGAPGPRHLFVSGSRAPHQYGTRLHEPADDEGLRRLVGELGGLGPDEAMGRAYLERRLPVLRADLQACESYRWQPRAPLDCPMTAFSAAGDPIATEEQLDGWREYTAASLLRRHLPGGHFYLNGPSAGTLLACLRTELDRLTGPAAPLPAAARPPHPHNAKDMKDVKEASWTHRP
jgi:thioesterase